MTDVDRQSTRTTVSALVRRAVSFELGVWRSLYRWTTRRPLGPEDAETFGYARPVTPVIWAFIGLSAIEIPVAHLLLPWQTERVIVLVVGIWGLTWMLGLLASLRTYPHVVGGSGLRIRYGTTVDITVSMGRRRVDRSPAPRPAQLPDRPAQPLRVRHSPARRHVEPDQRRCRTARPGDRPPADRQRIRCRASFPRRRRPRPRCLRPAAPHSTRVNRTA